MLHRGGFNVVDFDCYIELDSLSAQGFAVAVYNRQKVFKQARIIERLEDALGTDSMGISPRDTDSGGLLLGHRRRR